MFKTKCAELVLLKGQPAGQEGGTPNRGGLNQGKGEVYYDIVHSDPQLIRISIGNERSMSANIVHTQDVTKLGWFRAGRRLRGSAVGSARL
eukprot:9503822-Pyramimonas_sp.AAC.3